MKVRILVILGCLLISNLTYAQHFITGWNVGLNVAKLSLVSESEAYNELVSNNYKNQLGFEFGVFKDILINEKWSINTNVGYQLRRHEVFERQRYFSYLNINPSIKFNIYDNFNISSGFNSGVLINALEVYEFINYDFQTPGGENVGVHKIERNINKQYTTIDLQWTTGLEVKLNSSFSLELRGAFSLIDLKTQYNKPANSNSAKAKFYTFSLKGNFYI